MNQEAIILRLKEHELKATSQRIVIYNVISTMHNHPSAEDVYALIGKDNPSISLATVYKTLESFVEKGLISKISTTSGKMRYDPKIEQHNHIYCTNTNDIYDFHDQKLEELLDEFMKSKQIENFEIKDIKLLIKGNKIDPKKKIVFK